MLCNLERIVMIRQKSRAICLAEIEHCASEAFLEQILGVVGYPPGVHRGWGSAAKRRALPETADHAKPKVRRGLGFKANGYMLCVRRRPCPETIAAVRWVGDNIYGIRYGKAAGEPQDSSCLFQ